MNYQSWIAHWKFPLCDQSGCALSWKRSKRMDRLSEAKQVATVERWLLWRQGWTHGLSATTKKSGCYSEVAVTERWPLVEAYSGFMKVIIIVHIVSLVMSGELLITIRTNLPVAVSHTLTVWSKDPVSSWSPVVLNEQEIISAEWPCGWKEHFKISFLAK